MNFFEAGEHGLFVYINTIYVLQELMNENKDLQVHNESMQAQISTQVCLLTLLSMFSQI